jgi:tetratricopeptide (TPR) repeat protein
MADVLSVVGAWLQRVWEFVLTNPEVSVGIASGIVAALGWVGRVLWRRHQRSLRPPAPPDEFPFEILLPCSDLVVRFVYQPVQEKDDTLDDFNIPYQQRQPGQCFLDRMEGCLRERRWVLLLGRTGLGKTREVAELAQRLNHEGWTILRLKNHVEIEVPSRFEAERFGPQPRILFVLDNLNQLMALDAGSHSAMQEDGKGLTQRRSTQERLLEVLEFYERALAGRVWVVATARNERNPERNGLPSQWEMLGMEKYPEFWGRFAQIELEPPAPNAFENFLARTAKIAKVSTENISTIVRQSDLNFRNAVENIWTLRNRQHILSPETFSPTLRGTWQDHYNRVIVSYPIAKHLYDAIDLLKQVKVDLDHTIVLELTRCLINPRVWQSWWIQWQLVRAVKILAETERILQPRDGQIEAKGTVMSLKSGASQVIHTLIALAKTQETYYTQLFVASQAILRSGEDYQSAQLGFQTYLKKYPSSDLAWFYQGNALSYLGNYKDAITSYDQALAIKPNDHATLYNKGNI